MRKEVFVWKESVYKNRFICKCGNRLADPDGSNVDMLIENYGFRRYCYCKKCANVVAYLKLMEIPEDEHGLIGNITEYERRKMN